MLESDETNTRNTLLTPKQIEELSKSITETLYSTGHTRTVYENVERLNVLLLVNKYCSSNLINHAQINRTNCACFLNAFVITKDEHESLPPIDVTKAVIDYYEKLIQLQQQKQRHLEMVMVYNRTNCTIPNFTYKKAITYECLNDLSLIQKHTSVTDTNVCSNHAANKTSKVSLGYALLNFSDTKAASYLYDILLQWSKAQLGEEEATFVEYLWEHLDVVSDDVINILLSDFKFVFEKNIIKTCTSILKAKDCVFEPNVEQLFNLCSKNKKLKCIIKNILYKLYASSGFNVMLLELIKRLEY